MRAKVLSVSPNQSFTSNAGKEYKATVLRVATESSTYQGRTKPSEEKEYKIFSNKDYHATVLQLKPGMRIELKMTKNGNYWDISDIVQLEGASPAQASAGSSSPAGFNAAAQSPVQGNIVPSVTTSDPKLDALRLAGDVIMSVYENGEVYKKKVTGDLLADDILKLADKFLAYATGKPRISDLPNQADIPQMDMDPPGDEAIPDVPF